MELPRPTPAEECLTVRSLHGEPWLRVPDVKVLFTSGEKERGKEGNGERNKGMTKKERREEGGKQKYG